MSGQAFWSLAVVAALATGCGTTQQPGYSDGVDWAQQMFRFGDPQALQEGNTNDNFRFGACQPQALIQPADRQQGFLDGCIETLRAAQ